MPDEQHYTQPITRQNPGLFVFLLDQSFAMSEPIGGNNPDNRRKMDQLALAVNAWLQEMVVRSTRADRIRHFFDVAAVGFRTDCDANAITESPFGGILVDRSICSIIEIGENPARIEPITKSFFDEDTSEIMEVSERRPLWVEPRAEGGTPTCSAFYKAYDIVDEWIQGHIDSFPPIVIHVTDGESQEGDPKPYADALKELETEHGNVLLFNCHLSLYQCDPVLFPNHTELLPDLLAQLLFSMSSVLPQSFRRQAHAGDFKLQPRARGMAYNADMVALIQFLDVCTRVPFKVDCSPSFRRKWP